MSFKHLVYIEDQVGPEDTVGLGFVITVPLAFVFSFIIFHENVYIIYTYMKI